MKTEYGLRPNTQPETEDFPKLVRDAIGKFDDAEQSYFRNNPGEIGKNPKIAKAIFVDTVVLRVVEMRLNSTPWMEVRAVLQREFGLEVSVSTLRRWAARAV